MMATFFATLNEAAAKHSAAIRDVITHAKRVVREAAARDARDRADNSKLVSSVQAQRAALGKLPAAMNELQRKARKFRVDNGLPVVDFPEFGGSPVARHSKKSSNAPKSDEEEDFSQRQIMIGNERNPA